MRHLKYMFVFILILTTCGYSQDKSGHLVGGPCEGCEAIFEYGHNVLTPVDTLPDFHRTGPKLKLTGTVYLRDGKTPAKDVILYIYHTNRQGVYEILGHETGWARRHGRIRGWVKTGADGRYTFYTLKPGTYPDRSQPAHIHPTVLEPDGKYYWLGSYYFGEDPLLTDKERFADSPRGGSSGVLNLKEENGLLVGNRDIILGLNIPNYEQ